jgi:hypothetical protein
MNEQKSEKVDRTVAIEAFSMAKRYVKDRLKAPSTAKFPWYSDGFVEKGLSDRWVVTSYVDAQNSFGAMLRVPFMVEMIYEGNHSWSLKEIILFESE